MGFTAPPVYPLTPILNVSVGLGGGVIALVAGLYFMWAVLREDQGNAEMRRLRGLIYDGARTYLFTQYRWLTLWAVVMFGIISALLRTDAYPMDGVYTALCFLLGSFLSATAGYIGMAIATQANSRTAEACKTSMTRGLQVSFASGAVMGQGVVGLGILGLGGLYLLFTYSTDSSFDATCIPAADGKSCIGWAADPFFRVFNRLAGFGFGASTIGMFARVGGGVFTKAADVGSDLVGKVEQGIPEDDPRNPAVIADNVGDNVGDVAGMGADLFESYAGAVIATATLGPRLAEQFVIAPGPGVSIQDITNDYNAILTAAVALPFWINGFGILASLLGIALVRNTKLDDSATLDTLLKTITNGVWLASAGTTAFTALAVGLLFRQDIAWKLFGATVIGLVAGVIIAKFTEYCTAYEFAPTRDISAASEYGAAPVIIKGMGIGLLSVSVPAACTAITILSCNALAGQYAIAISAVGLLSTLGITLATDAYGPVADNAGGIAEMAGLEPYVRSRTDKLDSLGNTTAATGKGLAIASASLTAVGLIAAFIEQSGLVRTSGLASGTVVDFNKIADLSDGIVLTGVLIGAALPMIFGALTMLSVDRGARAIITEVRLQFATAPMLMRGHLTQIVDGHTYPDVQRCVKIATEAAIQEMVLPGVLAVFVPVCVGFILGPKGTCGLLAGALGGCFMLAITMATAGGAWDNAKKWCERCAEEGEPISAAEGAEGLPATRHGVTFSNFGVKKARNFPAVYQEHGIEALVRDPGLIAAYNTQEGLARLQVALAELYHKRHAAVVVGDTVGDPFKDTSGPSLNVLIKTMTMMALMLAPAYKSFGEFSGFGAQGSTIGGVTLAVVGILCYGLVSWFNKMNKRKHDEAVAAKKAADAKVARMNGGAAGPTDLDAAEGGSANDTIVTPLIHSH